MVQYIQCAPNVTLWISNLCEKGGIYDLQATQKRLKDTMRKECKNRPRPQPGPPIPQTQLQ